MGEGEIYWHPTYNHVFAQGMTLRDCFAGQAAASILGGLVAAQVSTSEEDTRLVAKSAYMLADAMMEARKK